MNIEDKIQYLKPGDVAAALIAGAAIGEPRKASVGSVVIVPDGYHVEDLASFDLLKSEPLVTDRKVTFHEAKSFGAYIKRFESSDLGERAVFADKERRCITAIVDYDSDEIRAHGVHRAIYPCPLSNEWKTWTGVDGKALSQREFAEFLEENIADVSRPDQADLLEIAAEFGVLRERTYVGATNLRNGTIKLEYTETDKPQAGKKSIDALPEEIVIFVPVFYRQEPVEQRIKFRYRIDNDGGLKFVLKFHRRAEVEDAAFDRLVDGVIFELPKGMDVFRAACPA